MNFMYIVIFFVQPPMFLSAEKTLRAAVFEPTILSRTPMGNVSRDNAIAQMKIVLKGYADVATKASKEGVNILVFPENGLIAHLMNYSRTDIENFLDIIPQPNKVRPWIPCDEPDLYPRTQIQEAISCIAKENKIYLVVNVGDMQLCNHTEDSNCPSDGRYQYNTNVVYSSEGALVSRYHKKHLSDEPYYNVPKTAEYAVFDTPFGRFASIVSYDIFFNDTLNNLIEKHQVSNILFPNLWLHVPPFFLSSLFHNSIAKAFKINLISANVKIDMFPDIISGGSGIYTPSESLYSYKPFNSVPSDGYLQLEIKNIEESERKFLWPLKREVPISDNSVVKTALMTNVFPVSAVILQNDSGIVSVCNYKVCCSLEYEFMSNRTLKFKINYILAISNKKDVDLTNPEGKEMQSCLLCPIYDEKISCLMTLPADIPKGDVSFRKLKMTAHNFNTPYLFPHIATFNSKTYDINTSWKHDRGKIENTKPIEKVFTAIIFGRLYPITSSATSTVFPVTFVILLNLISKELLV
ncbi:pantetheinase [Octopus bimaculoides]|uniref:pantetheinase n=1 Tax=Octopus bimaculoides TaxID=37653 RepID=UPI00071DD3CB|nr:pantetheinase [Octopus bimaculoides]|eukprot:XP_014768680.1 PREDICTED: pantetheinase-like [Octopus bimaculoides]